MKKPKRRSKVTRAINYIRDFGLGRVPGGNPEKLRKACRTLSEYIAALENKLDTQKAAV